MFIQKVIILTFERFFLFYAKYFLVFIFIFTSMNHSSMIPWKESYDNPRQCIKKQRHRFFDKGPNSPSYGFSSSHVQM